MSGKGSKPRPFSVDKKVFDENWDRIFGKKENKFWVHDCDQEGVISVLAGEECNWCGMKEDSE